MAMSVQTINCGKDGFPRFGDNLTRQQLEMVTKLKAELSKNAIVLKNTNPTAVARMKGTDTKDVARQRHALALEKRDGIIQQATQLYLDVQNAQDAETVERTFSGAQTLSQSASSMNMEEITKMCVAAAGVALSRQSSAMQQLMQLQQQQQQQQPESKKRKVLSLADREQLEEQVEEDIRAKIRGQVEEDLRAEIRGQVEEDIRAEIRKQIEDEMWYDDDLRDEIEKELRVDPQFREDIKDDMRRDDKFMKELEMELKAEIRQQSEEEETESEEEEE